MPIDASNPLRHLGPLPIVILGPAPHRPDYVEVLLPCGGIIAAHPGCLLPLPRTSELAA